jgi:ribonuclease G
MSEELLLNITPREIRIALIEEGNVQEIFIERRARQGLLGNIYKGRINRILPGIQAAFVDVGLERAGFLHVSDLNSSEKDIQKILQGGQQLLVQVYKDSLGAKGARLTTQFSIPARYIVFTPGNSQIAFSQKITDENERERLLKMITPNEKGGYIFRTAAVGIAKEEIDADKKYLDELWNEIQTRAKTSEVGVVYQEIPIYLKLLRDLASRNISKIRVDDENSAKEMQEFAKKYIPAFAERIEFYNNERPILDMYSVEEEINKILERKIYLKSGGYLVFDHTEAMTTIDVNTGSDVGKQNAEQTIFRTNLEAAEMIARQVRLRNLGGIIIIDFIDLEDPVQKTQLLETLKAALAKDSVRTEVRELTTLGLVEMTRKRARNSLEHTLCVSCPQCHRRGSVKSISTICYDIFRELKRSAHYYAWPGFLVLASKKVIQRLMEEESGMLADVESQLGKPIKLKEESSYDQEKYDILPLSEKGTHH